MPRYVQTHDYPLLGVRVAQHQVGFAGASDLQPGFLDRPLLHDLQHLFFPAGELVREYSSLANGETCIFASFTCLREDRLLLLMVKKHDGDLVLMREEDFKYLIAGMKTLRSYLGCRNPPVYGLFTSGRLQSSSI
jgi:hypothetical protein